MEQHDPPAEPPVGSSTPNLPIQFTPVPVRARHDGWTAKKQVTFIEALAESGCVETACRRAGMSDSSAYELRRRPCGASFRRAWETASHYAKNRLADVALDRSINGVARPIFYKGRQIGEWRHFDERLTIYLLHSRRFGRPDHTAGWLPTNIDEDWLADDGEALEADIDELAENAPETDGNPAGGWADGA